MTGLELIAAERARQVEVEGFTPEHDERHSFGELGLAGAMYAAQAARQTATGLPCMDDRMRYPGHLPAGMIKPVEDPIRNLVKAGALIAAEIDRLQRAQGGSREEG